MLILLLVLANLALHKEDSFAMLGGSGTTIVLSYRELSQTEMKCVLSWFFHTVLKIFGLTLGVGGSYTAGSGAGDD
jgi:hypothetical protein